MASKYICDCGIGYGDLVALELCQNNDHGRPRPPSTDLSNLVAAVQCCSPGYPWETIAAFNSWAAAKSYMHDCRNFNSDRRLRPQYRTIQIEHKP